MLKKDASYIWFYLRRYPKWLAMNLRQPFYLLLLTWVCRRFRVDWWGISRGDVVKLLRLCLVMFGVVLTGIVGRILLSLCDLESWRPLLWCKIMRNDIYAKLQEYSHHSSEQIGVSSLVTRITSDALCLCSLRIRFLSWGYHSFDDGFSVFDFDDKSIWNGLWQISLS